jgi:hypothetical protein
MLRTGRDRSASSEQRTGVVLLTGNYIVRLSGCNAVHVTSVAYCYIAVIIFVRFIPLCC